MLSLREIQQQFAGVIENADTAQTLPIRQHGISGVRRLQVYRNNYVQTHTEALKAVYPAVKELVGTDFFAYVAAAYLDARPSTSGNIQDHGAGFADFLRQFPAAESVPYLGDVAQLEWLRQLALGAPDVPALDTATLTSIPEYQQAKTSLTLHPGCGLLDSPFPVVTIWRFCQRQTPEGTLNLDMGGESALVFRDLHQAVQIGLLSKGECLLLSALRRQVALGAALQEAFDAEPELDAGGTLRRWITAGVITNLVLPPVNSSHG